MALVTPATKGAHNLRTGINITTKLERTVIITLSSSRAEAVCHWLGSLLGEDEDDRYTALEELNETPTSDLRDLYESLNEAL